jgi:hypothetical protein
MVENLGSEELRQRYFADRPDGLSPSGGRLTCGAAWGPTTWRPPMMPP